MIVCKHMYALQLDSPGFNVYTKTVLCPVQSREAKRLRGFLAGARGVTLLVKYPSSKHKPGFNPCSAYTGRGDTGLWWP